MMISELRQSRILCHRGAFRGNLECWPESSNAPQRLQEVRSPRITRRKTQGWNPTRSHQLGRHHEQALAKTLQRGPLQMGWDTEPLEPIQQVVGQQHNLEERLVRLEVVGRNLSQGVGIL